MQTDQFQIQFQIMFQILLQVFHDGIWQFEKNIAPTKCRYRVFSLGVLWGRIPSIRTTEVLFLVPVQNIIFFLRCVPFKFLEVSKADVYCQAIE